MKTILLTTALLFSTTTFAAENSLVRTLVNYAQAGANLTLSKTYGNCDASLALRQTIVPQSQSQVDLQFGGITLRADLNQQDAVMTKAVEGGELVYRQHTGTLALALSHYLPRVRNQVVKLYSGSKILSVEAIEYNYGGTPEYKYCEYLVK